MSDNSYIYIHHFTDLHQFPENIMNQEFNDQLPAELLLQLVRERYPGIAEVSIPRSLIFFFFSGFLYVMIFPLFLSSSNILNSNNNRFR